MRNSFVLTIQAMSKPEGDADIDEIYDTQNMLGDDNANDLEVSTVSTTHSEREVLSVFIEQEEDDDDEVGDDVSSEDFTVSLHVGGKLFVLKDKDNGMCVACNATLKTLNRGSNLTKHLVRSIRGIVLFSANCFSFLF